MRFLRPQAVILAVVLVLIGLRPVEAKGDPIPEARWPELTQRIFDAPNEDKRDAVLNILLRSPRETHGIIYGKVVGPVFHDRARAKDLTPEQRRAMYATVIAHLADDQPDAETVLLVPAFLPLLADDEALVTMLRRDKLDPDINGKQQGWVRVLKSVQRLLLDTDPTLRRSAVRISAHCECVSEADTLAALYEALKTIGADATQEDATAFLGAAERLLKYRFADTSALLKFLGDRAARFEKRATGWTDTDRYRIRSEFLADIISLYQEKGGEGIQKARTAALVYGKTLIEKADKPADLLDFFDPKSERFEELQRLAIAATAPPRMKPTADAAWADLLVAALDHSDDAGVLDRVVKLIGGTFTEQTKDSQQLAAAVARRLKRGIATDTLPHRLDLAGLLGRIGTRGDVRAALPERLGEAHAGQKDVWARLIRAFGIVQDGLVIQVTPYYSVAGNNHTPEWARLAVAQSLGSTGFRTSQEQGGPASIMLLHILTGQAVKAVKVPVEGTTDKFVVLTYVGTAVKQAKDGDVQLDLPETKAEDAPSVVAAAIDSLEFYPSENAATVLATLIAGGEASADTALKVLGRQLHRDDLYAARAMAGLLRGGDLSAARLGAALEAIQQATRPTKADARTVLADAVRGIMAHADTSEELRREAAGVSAHLGDVLAVKPVYLTLGGLREDDAAGREAWGDLLQKLVVAVAKSGKQVPGLDKTLGGVLREIASEKQAALVLSLFQAMGQDADRFALKRDHADLRVEHASDSEGRSREDRRKDLDGAAQLFRELVSEAATEPDRADLNTSLYRVLVRRAEPDWLASGEKAEAFLLEALKVAVASGGATLAKEAQEQLVAGLRKSGGLTQAQKSELEQAAKQLQELVDGKAPEKK